ncbi:VPLPA-CTERM sorting domain-containing protein [Phaeovibrio sulfidiphilus]|uniref:VPLPA-CTERM sorting domain-containing protein n=1 Tax=Phaeovibrio sulfidiphilus TaxID=1220600 RepID=A0A8J7CPC2_9PROT|nr:VPLPA-CTERM sorting domain-containing protein [Phaeovibrio sulfidiphilus]MBE1236872.1 VPLPA-CTERM sorting domain-containing protein [Phaeovibrio sulfidiphilus]
MKHRKQRGAVLRSAAARALAVVAALFMVGLTVGEASAATDSPSWINFNGVHNRGHIGTLRHGDNGWAYSEYEFWNRVGGKDGIIQQSGLTGVNNPTRGVQLGKRIEGLAQNSTKGFGNTYSFALAEASRVTIKLAIDRNWDDSKNWNSSYGKGALYNFIDNGYGNQLILSLDGQSVRMTTGLPSAADSLTLEFANLPKGDYIISVSGITGWIKDRIPGFSDVHMAYNLDINAYETPLPGALILLGTALAGAGVAGRRRSKKVAAAR